MNMQKPAKTLLMVIMCGALYPAFGQNLPSCDNRSFNGSFGFNLKGTNFSIGEYAIIGRMTSDGNGHFGGSGSESTNGSVDQSAFTGTYTVHSDCTGTASLTFSANGVQDTLSFVLVNDGEELLFIDIGGGTVETGSAKKQFHAQRQWIPAAKQDQ